MDEWDGLSHLGHEIPTCEVCELVVQCAALLDADSVSIHGQSEALRNALAEKLTMVDTITPTTLVVSVWTGAKMLSALEAAPKGVLALGPRPGAVRSHSTDHVAAFYETAENAGYVSVRRWGLPSNCFLDIRGSELRAKATELVGCDVWFSAQELFAPAKLGIVAQDDGVWHRVYEVKDELELLSWADRIEREGLRAIVPNGFDAFADLLNVMSRKQPQGLTQLYTALNKHPEVARGISVWRGINEMGFDRLDNGLRALLDGMMHPNAGHPSARHVASGNLAMYYDNVAYTWPSICCACYSKVDRPARCPCRKVVYCNKDCQKAHWAVHRKDCSFIEH